MWLTWIGRELSFRRTFPSTRVGVEVVAVGGGGARKIVSRAFGVVDLEKLGHALGRVGSDSFGAEAEAQQQEGA